jgi:hypothetical protein
MTTVKPAQKVKPYVLVAALILLAVIVSVGVCRLVIKMTCEDSSITASSGKSAEAAGPELAAPGPNQDIAPAVSAGQALLEPIGLAVEANDIKMTTAQAGSLRQKADYESNIVESERSTLAPKESTIRALEDGKIVLQ